MKRGDILILSPPSPFNNPRPALVIQAVAIGDVDLLTVALITSDLSHSHAFRVPIHPTAKNGLRKPSEIMIDHIQSTEMDRIGGTAGEAESEVMREVDSALRLFLGLP